ncbi:LysR substrate-binding domain-containing protein [Microbacterium sp. YY-01]|uniref:LysR substrate-binding domain-containing protein n=1 Tax=Microbacterium sp. YY-01 TaxID=3421634 RepID=UPI003D18122A
METRRLHYFVTIVDSGTITRAAELLHIAQPALSQHVAALENEFGQQLLVRSRQGVQATAAGRSLYRYAQGILRLEQAARHDIENDVSSPSGTVTVGIAPYTTFSHQIIPIIRAIRSRYPKVLVRAIETLSVTHSQAIRQGQLDAGLIYDPGIVRGIRFERVTTEELCLVVPDGWKGPEGVVDDEVPVESLVPMEFVMPRSEHTLRRRLDSAMFELGAQLRVAVELEHTYPLAEAVSARLGAAVLPRSTAELLFGDTEHRILRIVQPTLPVTLSLATAEDQPLSRAAEVVIEVLREFTLQR